MFLAVFGNHAIPIILYLLHLNNIVVEKNSYELNLSNPTPKIFIAT